MFPESRRVAYPLKLFPAYETARSFSLHTQLLTHTHTRKPLPSLEI